MPPKSSHKGYGKATARVTFLTSVINRRLSLDRDRIEGFILEHIRGVVQIFHICGVQDERAWDLFYEKIFLRSSHDSPLYTIPADVAIKQ
jgi:hypothetical protein